MTHLSANNISQTTQGPHYLTDQKQPHMFKTETGLTVVNIFHLQGTGLNNIKLLVKSHFTRYANV